MYRVTLLGYRAALGVELNHLLYRRRGVAALFYLPDDPLIDAGCTQGDERLDGQIIVAFRGHIVQVRAVYPGNFHRHELFQ